jgi:hypothetical protein
MRLTISIVLPLVEPPAPYVTDTNDGSRLRSSASAVRRFSSPASVLGGKNSKENVGPEEARRPMRIRGLCSVAALAWWCVLGHVHSRRVKRLVVNVARANPVSGERVEHPDAGVLLALGQEQVRHSSWCDIGRGLLADSVNASRAPR